LVAIVTTFSAKTAAEQRHLGGGRLVINNINVVAAIVPRSKPCRARVAAFG